MTVRPGWASSRDIGPDPQARSTTTLASAETARASQRYGEWSPARARDSTASATPARSRWKSARYVAPVDLVVTHSDRLPRTRRQARLHAIEGTGNIITDVSQQPTGAHRAAGDGRHQRRQSGQRLARRRPALQVGIEQRIAPSGHGCGELLPGGQPGLGDLLRPTARRRSARPERGAAARRSATRRRAMASRIRASRSRRCSSRQPRSRSRTGWAQAPPRRAGRRGSTVARFSAQTPKRLPEPGVEPVEIGGVSGQVAVAGVQRALRGAAQRRRVRAGRVIGPPAAAADEGCQQQRVATVPSVVSQASWSRYSPIRWAVTTTCSGSRRSARICSTSSISSYSGTSERQRAADRVPRLRRERGRGQPRRPGPRRSGGRSR